MALTGGAFDHADELAARLRQAPGEEARRELAPTPDGPAPSRWSLRAVRATVAWLRDYTLSGVWRALRRARLRLRSGRAQQYSPDPAYEEKVARLLACLREAAQRPGRVVAVFLDEMGYTRWPAPAADWAPAAPAPAPQAGRAGSKQQQWRVIGALDALTGRLTYRDNYIVGREQISAFYHDLDRAYPDAERIYVVQDNWSLHSHEDVGKTLAGLPRIAPVWLPTYAPWLNPIEKLWRWLRQAVLKQHRLAGDWTEARRHVRTFFDQFKAESRALLHYVGLLGEGKLAQALRPSDYRF